MKQLFKLTGCLALAGLFASCQSAQQEANYQIIPMPQEIVTAQGSPFILKSSLKILYPGGNEKMQRNAKFLADYLKTATGKDFAIEAGTEGKNAIVLALGTENENPESYQMKVTGDGITITGPTEAGVFYGIQSLRKSLPVAVGADIAMPAVEINDAPRFGYRGAHFDTSRHFFTVDEIKTYIDMQALHNMNRLHWHITDDQGWRLEIKKYPKLTEIGANRTETVIGRNSGEYDGKPYGGFYTQEQAKEIVDYAAERYITVVPEIDLPGHMQAALAAYPELGCTGGPYEVWRQWGISEDVLCAGNDQVLKFLEDVYGELIEIFPSQYIHVGGDECPKVRWEKCPKCQARIKALGLKSDQSHSKEERLQSFVINHIEKFLNDHGRQIIGWDEILEGGLAPNATVMSWRGESGGIEAAKQKHDVIMTPNTYLYFDYYQTKDTENEPLAIGGYNPVEKVYSLEPVPASLNEEERKYIIGAQGNLWTEYILSNEHLEYMLLPRLAALSEVQWTQPENKNWERFLGNLDHILAIYNKMGVNYGKHIYEIATKYDVPSSDGTVEVTLSTMGDAPIYYTLDGTEPTEKSTRYNKPIKITENCVLQATAIRENVKIRTFKKEFQFNKATGKKVTLATAPTEKYTFAGASILTDGLRGDFNYSTGYWLGFFDEPMDITIDLGESTPISSVKIGVMIQVGEYVFPPTKITVWTATGKNGEFVKQGETSIPLATADIKDGLAEYSCQFKEVEADRVKVLVNTTSCIPDWHGARTEKGHLFVDEVIVE